MRHIAAYLLCVLGGNDSPSSSDIEKVISSFGGTVDSDQVERLLKDMEGKDVEEMMKSGKEKLSGISIGGSSGGSGAKASNDQGAAAEVKESVEEAADEVDVGGLDMFGDDDDY
ncbi:hypothetical protein ABG067_005595 [Albugo candida]